MLGETYLRSNQDLDQAEHYFSKGLNVAREQKAKSLELRLCLSMCDLHDLRKSADKRRSQLDDVYRSFSEGFDTADLVRAKARLDVPRLHAPGYPETGLAANQSGALPIDVCALTAWHSVQTRCSPRSPRS